MKVRDEPEGLALILELEVPPHRPDVVAEMKFSRRLDAGKNAFTHGAVRPFKTVDR